MPTMKTFVYPISLFLCLHWSLIAFAESAVVSVTDFGAKPDSKENAVMAVRAAVEHCRKSSQEFDSSTLAFPKGRYDFFPVADKNISDGFSLHGIKNLTIEGNGSEFVFHGIMGVASLGGCENIAFRNFSVDWDKPLVVQGEIVGTTDQSVDIKFDTKNYPFDIENDKLVFPGEGWRGVPKRDLLYDPKTKELVYQTRDCAMGWGLYEKKTEKISDDTVRIHFPLKYKPAAGTLIGIWLDVSLSRYGFNVQSSKNITVRNVDMYHALGLGIIAQRTDTLTLDAFNCKVNDAKGRVFGVVADAMHLNNLKGLVKIENCECSGMGDDFINLHGKNMMIAARIDDRTVEVSREQREAPMYSFKPGDEIWFLDNTTMQRADTATIEKIEPVKEEGKTVTHRISFAENIPAWIKERSVMENKTFNAELEVRNCKIGKRHRARGILVTTPLRTVIENNYFRSSGAAILIEGDTNYWYESGACGDVLIRDNVFEDCFSSGYAGDWGHAVITIHPSHRPQSDTDEPYHRNIRIENNTFKSFDYPILFARSVRDLKFARNSLMKTTTYAPFAKNQETFVFDGCRNVLIENNRYGADVLGKNVKTSHMNLATDIQVKDKEIRLHGDPDSK